MNQFHHLGFIATEPQHAVNETIGCSEVALNHMMKLTKIDY